MQLFLNNPLFRRAYLQHEIDKCCKQVCFELELEPSIQTTFKATQAAEKILLILKFNTSAETTAAQMHQELILGRLEDHLKSKQLWRDQQFQLLTKLK